MTRTVTLPPPQTAEPPRRAGGGFPTARTRSWASKLGLLLLVVLVGYLVLLPLLRLQGLAFGDGASAYGRALDTSGVVESLWTTLWLALGSVVIAVTLGTALAWMSVHLPRRWQWLANIPVLPIVIPAVASTTGWSFLLSPGPGYLNQLLRKLPFFSGETGPVNVYSQFWIIVIVGFSLASMVYLFVRSGLRNLDQELLEAAYTSGLSSTAAFLRIGLPILRPTLVYGASTALLLGLGQVTAPLILGTRSGVRVLATEVYAATAGSPADFPLAAALASPLLLAGFAVVLLQRVLLGNPSRFVSRGGKSSRVVVRPSRLAAPLIGLYGVVAIVLPLAALALVAFSPYWSGQIIPSSFTFSHVTDVLDSPSVVRAIRNSVVISLISLAIALPLGFVIASVVVKAGKSVLRSLLEVFANIPLGVPAVLFGVGLLFTYSRPPLVLYGTEWVIVVVYVTLMLPFTTRYQLSGLIALGPQFEEASRVCGHGFLRTKVGIVIPLMRASIGGAAGIMFVLMTHEFTASLLVRSTKTQVMGTKLFDLWELGSYSDVAALALIMCAITGVGVVLSMLLAGRDVVQSL
jgi:iron(III) transport system permease protein